jgi:ketosteroid isomerase-like protein
MKIRGVIVAVLVACHAFALSAAADEAATVAELKAAAVELDQAYANEDVATIERMVLPDHVSIAPRYGGAASQDAQIATFEQLERRHFDYSPIEVALLTPDVALVTFEKSYEGTYKGVPLPSRVVVSEIWLKQDDTWRQRLYQETPIEQQ